MQTKQLFITFAAAALCLSGVLTFSGCKKENESEPQKYTVKLNSQKETVTVGKTVELTATVTPSDGASAVWTSGNEKVAKVTGSALKGTVTGVAEGETCIYCTVNGQFKDSCKVTVAARQYTVKLNVQKDTVTVGKTVELTATVSPSEGANPVWTSGDEKVAKVTGSALKGTVTGTGVGKTYIYCTVNGKFKDSCEMTVRLAIYPEAPELECVKIGNTVWAPVNCGYDSTGYKYGKLYQWGRRNGCGYGATWTEGGTQKGPETEIQTTSTTTAPVSAASEDSTIFYKIESAPYDWLNPQTGTRWNSGTDSLPKKTTYDPCPTGWRVPTKAELTALRGSRTGGQIQVGTGIYSGMKGYWFDGSTTSEPTSGVFLPLAGYRNYFEGDAANRGIDGKYWSSSDNGYGNSWVLEFQSNDATMKNSFRAYGFSVRCVQE